MDRPGENARLPLMAYNFKVVVAAMTLGFKEVSGLARQHETLTYRHGQSCFEGEQIVKFYQEQHAPVTLSKGVIPGVVGFLHAWLETRVEVPMTVSLCNARGIPLVNWNLARVLPIKLTAPTFEATSNDVAIETLEVMAAGITIENPAPLSLPSFPSQK